MDEGQECSWRASLCSLNRVFYYVSQQAFGCNREDSLVQHGQRTAVHRRREPLLPRWAQGRSGCASQGRGSPCRRKVSGSRLDAATGWGTGGAPLRSAVRIASLLVCQRTLVRSPQKALGPIRRTHGRHFWRRFQIPASKHSADATADSLAFLLISAPLRSFARQLSSDQDHRVRRRQTHFVPRGVDCGVADIPLPAVRLRVIAVSVRGGRDFHDALFLTFTPFVRPLGFVLRRRAKVFLSSGA